MCLTCMFPQSYDARYYVEKQERPAYLPQPYPRKEGPSWKKLRLRSSLVSGPFVQPRLPVRPVAAGRVVTWTAPPADAARAAACSSRTGSSWLMVALYLIVSTSSAKRWAKRRLFSSSSRFSSAPVITNTNHTDHSAFPWWQREKNLQVKQQGTFLDNYRAWWCAPLVGGGRRLNPVSSNELKEPILLSDDP